MEEKKLRDLGFDDLGKRAVFTASDGDRQSGRLEQIGFYDTGRGSQSVYFKVGGVQLNSSEDGVEWTIQLEEAEPSEA